MVCRSADQKELQQNSNTLFSAQFIPVAGQSESASSPGEADYAMWNVSNSSEGTSISKSVTQIPHQGAKSAHSEMRGSSQQSLSANQKINNNCHGDHPDNMQKKMDSSRYANDLASSHNASGGFPPNNGNSWQRNATGNGPHSGGSYSISSLGANLDTNVSHNKGSSFGAQYNNSSNNRAKNQGAEGNFCTNGNNSPYSAWPGLNSSTSVSSSNGWIIPNNISSRKGHEGSGNNGSSEKEEENMSVDSEMSYSELIGATGGSDGEASKQSGSNNNRGGNSWGMPSRLGLLGGGESSVSSGSSTWNGSQGPVTNANSSTWDNNRQTSNASDSSNDNTDMISNQGTYSGLIGATGGSDMPEGKASGENFYKQESHNVLPRLGLLGGGEGSLNTAPSGWGGPGPSGNGSSTWVGNGRSGGGNCDMNENSGTGMSPPKPHNSWAQAAGKGLNPCGPNSGASNTQSVTTTPSAEQPAEMATPEKTREETVTSELKMKAATSEGWGQVPVNQDSLWDVPLSPPPPQAASDITGAGGREGPTPVWRTPVNNGTEIWQNNLRLNKGAATPVTSTAPPWGHTPSTNIGGHWGDDDSSANMWSGVGPPNAQGAACWSEPSNPPNAMWGNTAPTPPVDKQWGATHPGNASWNDGSDSGRFAGNDNGTSVWNPPLAKQRNVGNWSPAATPKKDVQPSGWELPSPPTNRRPVTGGNYDDGTAVWGNPQRQGKVSNWKDMPSAKPIINSGGNMNPTGMAPMPMGAGGIPPSGPGMIRLPTGATVGQKNDLGSTCYRSPSMNRGSGWQDMPPHDGPNIGTWGDETIHVPNSMKNMPGMSNAAGGPFGSGWNDHNNSAGYWGAKPKGSSNWADGQVDTSSWLGPSKQGGKPLSRDLIWSCKQFRILIEMGYKKDDAENALRNNNMNIEEALYELRNIDSSIVIDIDAFFGRKVRSANANMPDDMSLGDNVLDPSFGAGNYHGANNFQASSNYPMSSIGGFKPQVKVPAPGNASNLISGGLGGQSSVGSFSPAMFQKLLHQQQNPLQQLTANMQPINNQGNRGSNFPSATQLRHLVQQIQMAVQAGHLNPQILNQPLAPQTLQLLYQLLQQIKVLTQLQITQQHQVMHMPKPITGGGPNNNNNAGLQLSVQVTQTKQRIVNLQNQIAAQQAVFLKQQVPQQPQPHQGLHSSQNADIFKPNIETMPSLQSDFRELSLKDVPLQSHQQSRLSQWKLPSYEKEESNLCGQNPGSGNSSFSNEFSRAPGPLPSKNSSSASSTLPNPGPNLHPLLSQGDSAWSSLSRSQGDSGWPEPATSLAGLGDNGSSNTNSASAVSAASVMNMGNSAMDNKESSNTPPSSGPSTSSASHTSYNLSDLVPEFEPGKPWKGTQLKNVEDDPHITPGSITRSPLSLNTIKDTDLFWNSKSSPATTSGNDATSTLASSTWNFTPSNTTVSNSSTGAINKSGGGKLNWSSLGSDSGNGSDVWGSISKSRGPPPGISSAQGGWDRQNSSTFLLLRNLTPQIDGSTLKTLCMQHGPLQLFHLSLNHGIALVRYSTREEASKAQSALNNCVLGNTTILADIPNESEIQQYLVLLSNQNSAGNMGWPASQPSNASSYRSNSSSYPFSSSSSSNASSSSSKLDSSGWNGNNLNMPSSQLWSYPNPSSALWGSSQPMSDHESSTNSSLNRFLPDDLLGGESM